LKFEQLLQIYWSRGFLYGGRTQSFNTTFADFFFDKPGFGGLAIKKFIQRFELTFIIKNKNFLLINFTLDQRKIINMYLSQIVGINNNVFDLIKYNMIRLFLIKTFRGRCFALGKPSRGQRTWSNASNAYKCNRIIRLFITQVKKINVIKKIPETLNKKFVQKKIKKSAQPKIRMFIVKKKKNLWF
jgi:hypothetical protein